MAWVISAVVAVLIVWCAVRFIKFGIRIERAKLVILNRLEQNQGVPMCGSTLRMFTDLGAADFYFVMLTLEGQGLVAHQDRANIIGGQLVSESRYYWLSAMSLHKFTG